MVSPPCRRCCQRRTFSLYSSLLCTQQNYKRGAQMKEPPFSTRRCQVCRHADHFSKHLEFSGLVRGETRQPTLRYSAKQGQTARVSPEENLAAAKASSFSEPRVWGFSTSSTEMLFTTSIMPQHFPRSLVLKARVARSSKNKQSALWPQGTDFVMRLHGANVFLTHFFPTHVSNSSDSRGEKKEKKEENLSSKRTTLKSHLLAVLQD